MKTIKLAIIWLIIGVLLGMWFGVNIGRDKPFYSNPFEAETIKEKIKKTGEEALEKSGESLESAGKAIQKKIKE